MQSTLGPRIRGTKAVELSVRKIIDEANRARLKWNILIDEASVLKPSFYWIMDEFYAQVDRIGTACRRIPCFDHGPIGFSFTLVFSVLVISIGGTAHTHS